MVERATLTQRLVDEAEPPERGEKWISDVRQKGFGLRLWRSPKGEPRKAYCIRVSDAYGNSTRRTLDIAYARYLLREESWEFRSGRRSDPPLGELISIARRWAHDELAKIKGMPTLQEEQLKQKKLGMRRAQALTLGRAAEYALRGMAERGVSQKYRDRIDKLFSTHIPASMAAKNICKVTLKDISQIFNSTSLKPGNLRILRPFLGQLLDMPARFGVWPKMTSYRFGRVPKLEKRASRSEQIGAWTEKDYAEFFQRLETEEEKWQQAYCLRIYLSCSAPITRVMAARWDEMWVVKHEPSFLRRTPSKSLRWQYRPDWRGVQPMRGVCAEIVRKCFEKCQSEFPNTPYLFPTGFGRRVEHIRSIDHMWRLALHAHKLRYVSPRVFRLTFNEALPWYGFNWEVDEASWL